MTHCLPRFVSFVTPLPPHPTPSHSNHLSYYRVSRFPPLGHVRVPQLCERRVRGGLLGGWGAQPHHAPWEPPLLELGKGAANRPSGATAHRSWRDATFARREYLRVDAAAADRRALQAGSTLTLQDGKKKRDVPLFGSTAPPIRHTSRIRLYE